MTSLEKAIQLALTAHEGQIDKGDGLPHISHCLEVMFSAREAYETSVRNGLAIGCLPEEFMAAAVLHDAVEDTHVTLAMIEEQFGPAVASIVDGVTRRGRGEYGVPEDREPYRDFISRAAAEPASRVLKTVDVLVNRGRTHKIKKASWRDKLTYKYDVAMRVLGGASPCAPAWERESFEARHGGIQVQYFIASPDGKRTEIAEAEARERGLIK